ncbi:CLUMA_CG001064, isoform A [Clunio marinus]|uniref:CLUMA_CG001064, isoform A n=1 Tax=Clunio marinus TaxID=568069 RepID=A0A1J1HLD7_9DIPT|nr:CLUMA_CG001064, isoform A [Clunio marinus]
MKSSCFCLAKPLMPNRFSLLDKKLFHLKLAPQRANFVKRSGIKNELLQKLNAKDTKPIYW